MKPTKLTRSAAFKAQFRRKSQHNREAIEKALRMMATNLRHPSLRTQKMRGRGDIWEALATMNQVMTMNVNGSEVYLRNCCNHTDVYRSR